MNLLIKGLSYLLISLFICSCSPTLYILDKNPQLAGRVYKTISLAEVDKRLKNNPNDLEALIFSVESLTTYAFGFLIEESDRILRDLSWDHTQGREYLQNEFNVSSRKELNEKQLIIFVDKLKSIRNKYLPQ